ncbi:MAG: UDP-N-acetylmuramoyl-L-alanyl-D-glutamate--2,6-diaminopimelate ligase [Myxococcota bacterium]|jgi:UDP-N-acetylmuramoyl-L-alanyl-D-glutamate--2,6-diaminopimelate ligase
MRLSTLIHRLRPRSVDGPTDRPIIGVSHDSREVGPADIFVAITGARVDGRTFTPSLDVAAVIAEGEVTVKPGVTVIEVADSRAALAIAAAALHGDPAATMPVVGITGTNGKTTTCWMLERILLHAGRRCGILGTNGHRIDGAALPDSRLTRYTTPEAPILQAILAQMQEAGCEAVAMEVSSIGLALRRCDALPFSVGVFTGLSRDHLDFHADMADYLAAKRRLFSELLRTDGVAILNADDPASAQTPSRAPVWTYSRQASPDHPADITAQDATFTLNGITATVTTPRGEGALSMSMVGSHNLENALAAVGVALALGLDLPTILAGLAALPSVPGRLERVPGGDSVRGDSVCVLVDYAHTPDALRRVLTTLRPITPGRIHTVFGCGGDRDAGKRPLMGAAASVGSDVVTVTSDNPRHEDPLAIIDAILPGITSEYTVQPDRRAAIEAAIAAAQPGDVILIAGKGHETYQIIGTTSTPFSDVAVAAQALAQRSLVQRKSP